MSVGYTPTPLAELEKRKEEKRKAEEARKEKERQKAEKRLRRKSSSELSQEDLFGEVCTKYRQFCLFCAYPLLTSVRSIYLVDSPLISSYEMC